MTKRLEEVFGIAPSEAVDEENSEETAVSIEESKEEIEIISSAMASTEKIDAALPMVGDLNEHDYDMDQIHKHAMDTFEKLVDIGMNVEAHAGSKFFESATQMLKTAMEAKDSKVDRKLKMINLQMQKAKLDLAIEKESKNGGLGDAIETEGSVIMDRNELLKRIAEARKISDSDK